ncbi:MAG: FAD-dependent oxidoreductase [Cytophagales bacterium]|nr:FAD-dependent oxidoreductase [Armatimonadota bacterium]
MTDVQTAVLEAARVLAPDVREITLRPDAPAPLTYQPGQWISLRLPVGEKPPLIRAYSMATPASQDGRLTLCFDRIEGGIGSEYLWTAEPGLAMEFSGPVGNFTLPETDSDLVFVAQHTGIVPFRAMLHLLATDPAFGRSGRRVHLVYGTKRQEDLVYHEELAAMSRRVSWLDYHPVVLEGAPLDTAATGSESDVLAAHAATWIPFVPMVCGVREFTLPTRSFFMEQLGFERRAVKVENYNGPAAR